jgi:hypothetical protein
MQYASQDTNYEDNNELRMDFSSERNNINNCFNIIGTINDSNDSCQHFSKSLFETTNDIFGIESKKNKHISFDDKINVNIYRYKFSDDFVEELYKFSKIHQYEERKTFKESWNIWVEDSKELIDNEMSRLKKLGYDGDILDKMYKSARYYFRKKSTEKKAPNERREYISTSKELRDAMDYHIIKNIKTENYKPSDGFDDFCKNNITLLTEEIKHLCNSGIADSNEIKNKFKKTYKNRYFMIIK